MSSTATQLAAFQHFATARIADGPSDLTIDELFDEWRLTNPSEEELGKSTRAIAASLRDLDSGETGRSADQVLDELRAKYGSCR